MLNNRRMAMGFIIFLIVILLKFALDKIQLTLLQCSTPNKTQSMKALIIVYNRVPKCGSSSMLKILDNLSKEHRQFIHEHARNRTSSRFQTADQIRLRQSLIDHAKHHIGRPLLYDQHFHFFDMVSTSDVTFKYINLIRDPLKQALSSFDYLRYNYFHNRSSVTRKRFSTSFANMNMEECVHAGDPARCVTTFNGVPSTISYFCGQSPICYDVRKRTISHAALSLAKSNIERFYTWVGILEYFDDSLELLEHNLPSIFHGITELYRTKIRRDRENVTPTDYRSSISNTTRDVLIRLLKPEYELYGFVRKRFMDNYKLVFGRLPKPSTD